MIAANPMISPEVIRKNNVVGDAATVIARLKTYEAMGYDEYSPVDRHRYELRAQEGVAASGSSTDVMPAFG